MAIVVFGGAVLLGLFSAKVGSFIERKVDSIYPLSYVSMNRGDEIVAEEITRGTRGAVLGAVASLVLAVVINVVSNYLSLQIGIH
jgi:hypothetical protein